MNKKYLVIGGYVTSKHDSQEHYISANRLCELYNINPNECFLREHPAKGFHCEIHGIPRDIITLRPRYYGNYSLANV